MEQIKCDVLVIGGGAAGSRAAYEAKSSHPKLDVLLAVAGKYGTSGSSNLIASESLGINAPFNFMKDGDNPDIYYQDMVETGGGLGDPKLCRIIADEACARIEELIEMGVRFDSAEGHPVQRLLSGCTKARSLTCGGTTGKEIVSALKAQALNLGIRVLEDIRIVEILKDELGRVCGVLGVTAESSLVIRCRSIVLATGGGGQIFRKNVNPPSLEGDGWAIAYRAGAKLVNMEFFQIGPAVVYPHLKFIIHSHMWRLKPRITNILGEEFLDQYCDGLNVDEVIDAKAMSYPFSVRTIAKFLDIGIFKEIIGGQGTGNDGVYFDVTHVPKDRFLKQAPITYETLKRCGVDLTTERIELGLAVQNFNGGIKIDENGFTGVTGLFAAGEVTGGVHGSDRPGGNNLTDTQVFGHRAGYAAACYAAENPLSKYSLSYASELIDFTANQEVLSECEDLYYREMTIVRTARGLQKVFDFISKNLLKGNTNPILKNRLLVGEILATAMLVRQESRGTHYREDFPHPDPFWEKRIVISKGEDGNLKVGYERLNIM
jgi:fumarate reductase (CoM/CoB) subunit A